MAFGPYHFDAMTKDSFMSFYEARFFDSRYMFIFRDPFQTVASCRKTFSYSLSSLSYLRSWLEFVILWADYIRVFPNTITLLLPDLDTTKLAELSRFLSLDLTAASLLLDPREQRHHSPEEDVDAVEAFGRHGATLTAIWQDVCATPTLPSALLQADQKRSGDQNGIVGEAANQPGVISVVSNPVGRAWIAATELLMNLGEVDCLNNSSTAC
jgi:hypothetical protein